MKITIEESGHQIVITEDDLESFGLSIPSDVYTDEHGEKELGRVHISLTGIFKDGVRPKWEAVE